jgi:glucose/arabinose dehydrogenase
MKFRGILFLLLFFIAGNIYAQPFQLQNAFPNLSFSSPIFLTHSNDGTNRIFVAQQGGLIRVLPNDSTTTTVSTFLNITNKVIFSGERGLLGLAFHPDYANNGYFYVNYTRTGDNATIISRFSRSITDPNKADSLSEYILLTIAQPFTNHNGGIIFFGLDGYLYIGAGDGGSGGDPGNRAQNPQQLLGKILRIDVDTTTSTTNYGIPPTNPFYGNPTAGREEIYTIGMRNPWRMSQDPVTGLIYCGDVGQNVWEEIDIIENGLNYGWRCYEGNAPYNTTGCQPASFYTFPIKVYTISGQPECSVTGGYVYRGSRRAPELEGRYIYGDYCSRKIWKLKYENGNVTEDSLLVTAPLGASILSFGTDQFDELYILTTGGIFRFNKSNLVGISNNSSLPDAFNLEQNYPNPFNPETKINYSIPSLSHVKLIIYDINGREIKSLVNTTQLAGDHTISWNGTDNYGSKISSGIYFYSITAGENIATKKMLMVK